MAKQPQDQQQDEELPQDQQQDEELPQDDEDDTKPDLYKIILNDPNLRKAFWKQPTLLGMVKFGDPVGYAAAQEIINKYKGGGRNDFRFKNQESVKFKILSDFDGKLKASKSYLSGGGKIEVKGNTTYLNYAGDTKFEILSKDENNGNLYQAKLLRQGKTSYKEENITGNLQIDTIKTNLTN